MEPAKHQHCGKRARSCGASRKGFRRYRCVVCGHTWTSDEPIGVKAPRVLGPIHEGCTNPSRSDGRMPDGRHRWRCPDCNKRWLEPLPGKKPRLPGTKSQRYYQRNREKIYEAKRRWREANPEQWRALVNKWRKANPERWRAMMDKAIARWKQRHAINKDD